MLVTDKRFWQWFDHPTEPEVRFRLRPLTDEEYLAADEVRTNSVIQKARTMGPELWSTVASRPAASDTAPVQLDATVAIKYALVEWTYTDELNDDSKRALDHATQQWLLEKIVEMNAPRPLSIGKSSNGSSDKVESPLDLSTPSISEDLASP